MNLYQTSSSQYIVLLVNNIDTVTGACAFIRLGDFDISYSFGIYSTLVERYTILKKTYWNKRRRTCLKLPVKDHMIVVVLLRL